MGNLRGEAKVVHVFNDVEAHMFTADIIKRHSENPRDIREIALDGLDLKGCRNILDLGCGFGFFVEALRDKVHPHAIATGVDIVEEYGPLFLKACEGAGIRGDFSSSGALGIRDFEDESYDLVICSYALYFFPEMISEISRVLSKDGLFISTVHSKDNMGELIGFARNIMIDCGMMHSDEKLPIEIFIGSCSTETCHELLSPWFRGIRSIAYANSLVFDPVDMYVLLEYFRFKWPFFLSTSGANIEEVFDLFEIRIQKYFSRRQKKFIISKDDTIFICSNPIVRKGAE